MQLPTRLETMMPVLKEGLRNGARPKLTDEGTSGTYLMRSKTQVCAIFKPIDEEQFAPNNPRDFRGKFGDATFREGVLSGESTVREIAAYLLDHEGFAGVPQTSLVSINSEYFNSQPQQIEGLAEEIAMLLSKSGDSTGSKNSV